MKPIAANPGIFSVHVSYPLLLQNVKYIANILQRLGRIRAFKQQAPKAPVARDRLKHESSDECRTAEVKTTALTFIIGHSAVQKDETSC